MLAYHIIRAPAENRSRDLPVPRRAPYHWATDLSTLQNMSNKDNIKKQEIKNLARIT